MQASQEEEGERAVHTPPQSQQHMHLDDLRWGSHVTPLYRTHSTHPRGGLGAQGEGGMGSRVWNYLSVQPSFTFIFVFLKWNWSIRKGLVFVCMHCTENDLIFPTWWLHWGRVATGASPQGDNPCCPLCLILWLTSQCSVLGQEECHCP